MRFILMLLFPFYLLSSELHVCTVASDYSKVIPLLKSCKKHQLEMDVLGVNLPYKGNGQKLTYLRQYLENIPDDDIVLLVDGYDVLFLVDAETILNKFYTFNSRCVISAEMSLWPGQIRKYRNKFPKCDSPFKYLNAGSIMGYADTLKKILNSFNIIENFSDQAQWIIYYVDHQDEITLDNNCELFLCLYQIKDKDLDIDQDAQTVKCNLTNTYPCLVHANGGISSTRFVLYNVIYGHFFDKISLNE